jgi:23S rRNA (adenine2503-C2)-methyltransferase
MISEKILENIKVPTGNICTMAGEKGKLEFISVGDYGKTANIKADFLGLSREIEGVPNGTTMPLTKKWVITISTQYGCSMGCKFCDVPKVGPGVNASFRDMMDEIEAARSLHPEITHTERLNVHYARMGEPTWNKDVIQHVILLKDEARKLFSSDSVVHPVVSTMMPKSNTGLLPFLWMWCKAKNEIYDGEAGLQFSINSTDEKQREFLFNGNAMSMKDISALAEKLPSPRGRKYTLNFALADDSIIDEKALAGMFDVKEFICKITPLHRTKACEQNNLKTSGGYDSFVPYKDVEERLKSVGFDVIVFVPSLDEDTGLITCGNAILSGRFPQNGLVLKKTT